MRDYHDLYRSPMSKSKAWTILSTTASALLLGTCHASAVDQCLTYLEDGYEYVTDLAIEGDNELHVPIYAWHSRYAYSQKKIRKYNEILYGFGFGRGKTDCDGNWGGVFGMWFLDSHKNVEPLIGVARTFNMLKHNAWEANIGFAALITARKDIKNYTPFPGILPVVSVAYQPITLYATYIPVGNVVCIFSKVTF